VTYRRPGTGYRPAHALSTKEEEKVEMAKAAVALGTFLHEKRGKGL
jgi:hypothetical protein